MAMRALRSRKSGSIDAGGGGGGGSTEVPSTASDKKADPKLKTEPSTPGSSPRKSARINHVEPEPVPNDEEEEYPALPLFGLSELAMSTVANLTSNDEEDEGEEEEEEDYEDDEGGDHSNQSAKQNQASRKKRTRNPPREPVICPSCGKHFTRKAHLVRHMYLHTGEKPFKCTECDQSFNRKDHLQTHIRSHSTTATTPAAESSEFQCVHCNNSFKRSDLLRMHMLKIHGRIVNTATATRSGGTTQQPQKTSPSIGFKILTCTVCNKRFTQEHLYKAHLLTHKNQKSTISNQPEYDEEQSMDYEDDDEQAPPDEDGFAEDDESGNQTGIDQDIDDEDEEAQPNETLTKEDIERMLAKQSEGKKKFECVVCAKQFSEQRSLRRHYKLHRRNFVCRFCGVKMSSAGSLMRHNLLHTGEKPFQCELCSRRFSRKDALKAHLAAHDKESNKVKLARPYKCNYCTARYTMRYNLIRHLRQAHQGASRGSGSNGQAIRGHQMIQKRNQPQQQQNYEQEEENEEEQGNQQQHPHNLQCKHCGKLFANMKSLSTHVWYHNQEKRFVCKVCNHGFKYATDLSRHLLTHRTKSVQSFAQNRLAHARQTIKNAPSATAAVGGGQRAQPTHNSIIVNGQRLYPCGVCGQIFNHRSNRSRHMRLFHRNGEPTQQSPQQANGVRRQLPNNSRNIQQSFARAATATNIMAKRRVIPGSVPIINKQPGLAERIAQQQKQAALTLAEQNDDDEAPNFNGMYKCGTCGKLFNKRYNYKLHMRTHNKQFLCIVCGLRTASQGDLTLHIRTHTGEKPFKCSRCDWRFCRRSALTVHYRRHHGPNAKVKRHYNPQRVTPNIVKEEGTPADDFEYGGDEGVLGEMEYQECDGGILEDMLKKEENEEEDEVQEQAQQQQRRKNLPPPPPLIRYPVSGNNISSLKNAITVHKVENEQDDDSGGNEEVFLCRPCGSLITGKAEYVEHMYEVHGTAVSSNSPSSSKQPSPPQLQQRPKLIPKATQQQQQQAIPCRQCGEMFGSRHDMTVHVLVAHSTPNMPVSCGICKKLGTSIEFLSRHYQYVHPDVENAAEEARVLLLNTFSSEDQDEDLSQDGGGDDAANLLCPEVVLQVDNNLEGDEEEHQQEYEEYEEAETKHSVSHHHHAAGTYPADPNLPYPCPICNKPFKDKKALADHKWYHSREPIHPCTICGRKFKLKNDLIRHHRRHLQERPFECPEESCGSRFYQKMDLERHLTKVHNKVGTYSCRCCSMRFGQVAGLVRHMKANHPGEDVSQLLVLEACAKKRVEDEKRVLEYMSNLEGQEGSQEGVFEEGEQQNQHDYSFEMQQLEIDMSAEEGGAGEVEEYGYGEYDEAGGEEDEEANGGTSILQPCMKKLEDYTNENGELYCKPCNKPFKDLKTLQNHVYYHQRESKHACEDCGAKFKQKSDLRRHATIHHDPRKARDCISCPNCNRSFTDERYVRIHLNRGCDGSGSALQQDQGEQEEYEEEQEVEGEYEQVADAGNEWVEEGGEEEAPDPMMFLATNMQGDEEYEGQVEGGEEEAGDWDMEGVQEEYEYEEEDQQLQQNAFECDVCGAFFTRSNELILHKRVHAKGSKTFPFTSTSSAASSSHHNASSGNKKVKTFTCDKCGALFTLKAELTQHLQMFHLDELPVYQCGFCPKYFYVKKSLDTHKRRHHSHLMNLHPCDVCGAKFSQVEYLANHMRSHHGVGK